MTATRRDLLGNPVTVDSDAALAGVDDFVAGMLAYETRALRVLAAADADPGACLLNAYAAALHLLIEAPEGPDNAEPYLRRAEASAPAATPREQATTAFVRAWAGDDIPEAMRLGEQVVRESPRDLLMVKLLHYHAFNAGRFAVMLRIVELVEAANADVAWMHGMAAFAYEQCHLLDQAEAAARRALALRRKEPWAQHALAHVMLTQGRIEEGAAFLDGVQDTWSGLNSFMITHLWWHQALFRLSQGRTDEVLEIYDRHCWGVAKDYSQDQVGAVSLLARLEVSGVDVGDRWDELGRYLAARGPDATQPFLALQYLYGLGRAGRPEADALMAAIAERARTAPDHVRATWAEVALPTAEGLLAHARGDVETAVARLTPALPRLIGIGGSHAQRDLFDLILLDAVIRSGRLERAQQALELRRLHDPDGAPLNRALAKVYAGLGLARESAAASARAERR